MRPTPAEPTLSPDARRYVLETRLSVGRKALEAHLEALRDRAVHVAVYGGDPAQREVNSGRAQAYIELLDLFRITK